MTSLEIENENKKKENMILFDKRVKRLQEELRKQSPQYRQNMLLETAKKKLEEKHQQTEDKNFKIMQEELWGENNYLNLIFTKFINLLINILPFINFIFQSNFDISSLNEKEQAKVFIYNIVDDITEIVNDMGGEIDDKGRVGGKKKSKKTKKKKNTRKNKRKN